MKNVFILLLGGTGNRFGGSIPKQFLDIGKEMLFAKTSRTLLNAIDCAEIVFVVHPQYRHEDFFLQKLESLQRDFPNTQQWIALGKENRHQSFLSGWQTWLKQSSLDAKEIRLLVHDANRPHLSKTFLKRIKEKLHELSNDTPCFVPVISATDSLLQTDARGNTLAYLQRDFVKRVQTPQVLLGEVLHKKINLAPKKISVQPLTTIRNTLEQLDDFTDEGSMMLSWGVRVATFAGDNKNIKITYKDDV